MYKYLVTRILIFLLHFLHACISFAQPGPNDSNVRVAMDGMGIKQGMVIGVAGFKNIPVDTTLQYDNIYLAKKSD